jgi:hypothetical protein
MKNFYFTFGQVHHTVDGHPMRDYYVHVIADDYMTARQLFIEQFSSVEMDRPDRWSFQYTDDDFNPGFFPGGLYGTIIYQTSNQTS